MSDPEDTYGESSSRHVLLRCLEAAAAETAATPATVPCPSEWRGGGGSRKGTSPPPAPLALLVATGSYNPAHVDHVGIMGQARGLLEREGYVVAGGLMSPSCQRYVRHKLGDGALPAAWRASIVQAGIEGAGFEGWLRADCWEADQGGFRDHPYVGRSLREFLRRRVAPEVFERVRIFYVAGGDLYNACCKWGHDEHFDGVVAAAREGETEEVVANMRRWRGEGGSDGDSDGDSDGERVPRVGCGGRRPHFLLRPVPGSARIPNVSSTLVRDAMQRGDVEEAEEAMGTKAYEEFRRLCAGGKARDLVHPCSPPDTHAYQTEQAGKLQTTAHMHVTACLAKQTVEVEVGEDCRTTQALREAIVAALPQLSVDGFDVSVGGRELDDEGVVSLEEGVRLDVSANARVLSVSALREAGREVSEDGLIEAVRQGDVGLCTLYLDAGVPIAFINCNYHRKPLHHSCGRAGNLEVATLLLDRGAAIDTTDIDQETPLHYSCQNGHVAIATLLLDRGAAIDKTDNEGRTPLFMSCGSGHVEIVRLLLDRGAAIDKFASGAPRSTPLYLSCLRGHVDIVRLLLDHGSAAQPGETDDGRPFSPEILELLSNRISKPRESKALSRPTRKKAKRRTE